jgi:hypothetical protein
LNSLLDLLQYFLFLKFLLLLDKPSKIEVGLQFAEMPEYERAQSFEVVALLVGVATEKSRLLQSLHHHELVL